MENERRADVRVRTEKIRVRIASEPELRERYLRDLSEGGLFIYSDPPLPMGSSLEIDLFPPGWADPLALKGTVVRVAADEIARGLGNVGFAVALESPSKWTRVRLAALLAQHGRYRSPGRPAAPPTPPPEALLSSPEVHGELERLREERDQLGQLNQSLREEISERASQSQEVQLSTDAKLAEAMAAWDALTQRLVEADRRISSNAEKIAHLERQAARLAKEKHELEQDHRRESSALEEELEQLRRLVARRWVAPLLLVGLVAAVGYSFWAGLPWTARVKQLVLPPAEVVVPKATPVAVAAVDAGAPVVPAAPDAGSAAVDAGAPKEEPPVESAAAEAPLEPGFARVEFESPRPTRVWIPGRLLGRTPFAPVDLKAGRYPVRFECAGRGRFELTTVELAPGQTRTVPLKCSSRAKAAAEPDGRSRPAPRAERLP